jgi:dTDP-4-dehydrorhamnose 3,5-epimerase
MRTFADDRSRSYNAIVDELRGDLNVSVMYPGTIKAFHRHKLQDDFWFLAKGNVRAVLQNPLHTEPEVHYLREGSLLCIPAGVWHGVQVLGNTEAILVYYITNKYNENQPDEERAPWDKFYDWAISRK